MAGLSMTALDPAFQNDIVESAARIASGKGVKRQAEVAPEDYPMLVTFRDLADPASVEAVNPADFASVFGPGYALRRITVQVTEENFAPSLQERLRWLGRYPEPSLNPNHDPRDHVLDSFQTTKNER